MLALSLFAGTLAALEALRRDVPPVRGPADPVAEWAERTAASPDDPVAWARLGIAWIERARMDGDPTAHPKADAALQQSLAIDGTSNPDAFLGMSMLSAARHEFPDAHRWSVKAKQAGARAIAADAARADALLELGRFDEAFAVIDELSSAKPSFASYARVSYARELAADPAGALRAMELAVASAGSDEEAAFAATALGRIRWRSGDLDGAQRFFERALRHRPGFGEAREGLADIAAANGDLAFAIGEYRSIASGGPDPHAASAMRDLLIAAGRNAEADEAIRSVIDAIERLRALGSNVNVDAAMAAADSGEGLSGAIDALRRDWEDGNRSIAVADAMGWALRAAGQADEAAQFAGHAVRLGTRDPLLHFRAGMVFRAAGDDRRAIEHLGTAVSLNAHFSARWAPAARAVLQELGAAPS